MAHVTVAGSGITGLIASIALAKDGHTVTVHEGSAHIGGRARTERRDGYHLNLGPHALYNGGRLHRALTEFGVEVSGKSPKAGGVAWSDGVAHRLPLSPTGLLTTDLLSVVDKLDAGRLMASLPRPLPSETAQAWCQRVTRRPQVRELLGMLIRLVSYACRLDQVSMNILHPVLLAATTRGVLYVNGGWQTLIDGLAHAAKSHGVTIQCGSRLTSLDALPGPAVLCIAPQAVQRLIPEWQWSGQAVKASVLDVCLTSTPRPDHRFGLGWDDARYFGMHSATADLAPNSGSMLHVLGYMGGDEPIARADLEALMDDRQPGWRDVVHHARYLPAVTVSHAHPNAQRSAHQVREDVWIAGDWVGPTAVLADCAAESALHSASAVSASLGVCA